ncbi:MAG: hypothetical protein H7X79_09590 [Sporomusaceae bacterium]|nr:hypothetical protein [Sporomusaceae bacterium]
MNHIFKWVWHGITRCPKTALETTMYGTVRCRDCGRVTFISNNLPKMSHIVVNRRTSN